MSAFDLQDGGGMADTATDKEIRQAHKALKKVFGDKGVARDLLDRSYGKIRAADALSRDYPSVPHPNFDTD